MTFSQIKYSLLSAYFLFICCLFSSLHCFATQLIIEPEMGRQPLLHVIAQTKHRLRLVMYGFTDETLLNALLKQQQLGRTLHIILEQSPYKATDENKKTIIQLRKKHIPWQGSIPPFKLIHQKTLLVDDNLAMVMTFNFTKSTFKKERNFALLLDDKKTVRDIEKLFKADWNHVTASIHNPQLIMSPDNSRQQTLALIKQAKHSIAIYAPNLTDFKLVGELAKVARKGIKVRLLTSSSLRNKQFNYLQQAGVKIHQSKGLFIHAKVIMIDQRMVLLGSLNFTRPSFDLNRELSVITTKRDIVAVLLQTFNRDWQNSNNLPFTHFSKQNQRLILHTVKLINRFLKANFH